MNEAYGRVHRVDFSGNLCWCDDWNLRVYDVDGWMGWGGMGGRWRCCVRILSLRSLPTYLVIAM